MKSVLLNDIWEPYPLCPFYLIPGCHKNKHAHFFAIYSNQEERRKKKRRKRRTKRKKKLLPPKFTDCHKQQLEFSFF